MTFGEDYPAVRIPVTKEIIESIFNQSDKVIKCVDGLKGKYTCGGVIQNENGMFEFILFNKKTYKEGMAATLFMPTYKSIDCLDKQKVKEAVMRLPDDNRRHILLKELGLE